MADMFVAGSNRKAKAVARQLSKDAEFAECYDFGSDERVEVLKHFAMSWINLSILQRYERNIALKVLRR